MGVSVAAACSLLAFLLHDGLDWRQSVAVAPQRPASVERSAATLLRLPSSAQAAVSAALGGIEGAYSVRSGERGLLATNRAQGLALRFLRAGVSLSAGATHVGLSLRAAGYEGALQRLPEPRPSASGNRVAYSGRQLSTWYANGPLGLEQGFTVPRPARGARGVLTLSLALSGDARASAQRAADAVTFTAPGGAALRYGDLRALDARGRPLRSWLTLARGRLLLHVQTHGAAYPLRIDPLVQRVGALEGPEAETSFGASVALAADGETALIGVPGARQGAGGALVFVRSGASWSQQGPMLAGGGEEGAGQLGASVALSGDGDTAIVGGFEDDRGVGAAWVFTRSGTSWVQQGPKLKASGEVGLGWLGSSVALSADGETALVGAPHENGEAGAAWVFARSGSTWSQQGERLTGTAICGVPLVGLSVALSADGETAMIGGPWDCDRGAAWVFIRSQGEWRRQGGKLTAGGEIGKGFFANSIALSADGSIALIGGYSDDAGKGAAWIFQRSGESWAQQGAKLTGGGEVGHGEFGQSVALSADGSFALIGGIYEADGENGSVWTFARTPSGFKQQGARLVGSGEGTELLQRLGGGGFGRGVALSEGGDTALVGGGHGSDVAGRAWIYSEEPSVAPSAAEFGRCARVAQSRKEIYWGRYRSSNCGGRVRRGQYEWFAGVTKTGFSLSGGAARIEAKRLTVKCASVSGSGEYSAATLTTIAVAGLTLHGCRAKGAACSTPGAGAGEITTEALAGQLVGSGRRRGRIALELRSGGEGALARFSCGASLVVLQGGLSAPVATGRMSSQRTLRFHGGAGNAKLRMALEQTSEEAIEVRPGA